MVTDMKDINIWAYRRENGSLGVRNYVLLRYRARYAAA